MTTQDDLGTYVVIEMLKKLEPEGLGDQRNGCIGLRSGASFAVAGVSLELITEKGGPDGVVLAYCTRPDGRAFDEVRFLASQVEYVRRDNVHSISPERSEKMHSNVTSSVVDAIMEEKNSLRARFGRLATRCLETRPEWFVSASRPQQSEADGETKRSEMGIMEAIPPIVVSVSYEAAERSYRAFRTDKEWIAAAMATIDQVIEERMTKA